LRFLAAPDPEASAGSWDFMKMGTMAVPIFFVIPLQKSAVVFPASKEYGFLFVDPHVT
jgi:hypothetical protein